MNDRPVLLLPGATNAAAAETYFGDIYDCASWCEGDLDDDPKPYSNGSLSGYAQRKVTVWGAPRNKISASTVISELLRLKCSVRFIDLATTALDPRGAQISNFPRDQLFEFAKKNASDVTVDPLEVPRESPASPQDVQETPTDHRCRIKWVELKGKTPPDREWTISHWLTNGPTLLAGQGGIGKTHIAQTLGTAIAMGKQYIDAIPTPKRVLFWACEDDHDELWRRQIAICRHFDLEIDELEDKLIIEPRLGMENGLLLPNYGAPKWTEVKEVLREQVNDYQAEVLIVDNIGQCFGGNENDRHHVTAFLSGLVGLSVKPLAVLMLGHPAKSTGSEYSGSTAWEAAVRMRWYLGRKLPDQEDNEDDPVDDNTRYLCKRKANYSQLDYRQLAFQDGVYACQQPEGPTFTERFGTGFRKAGAESLVMLAIENAFASKIRVVAQENSPDSLLKHMRRIGYCQDYNNREILDAIARLRMERRIGEVAVGNYSNRMPKMGLAPARIGSAQSDSQSTT